MKQLFSFSMALCIIFVGGLLYSQSVLPFYHLEYKNNSTLRALEFFSPSLWTPQPHNNSSGTTLSGSTLSGSLLTY